MPNEFLAPTDTFVRRHVGPSAADEKAMLATLSCETIEQLIAETIPALIRTKRALSMPAGRGEREFLDEMKTLAAKNQVFRS